MRLLASVLAIATWLAASPAAARPEVTTNLAVTYGRRSAGAQGEGLFGLDLHAALLGDRESSSGFAAGGVVHVGGVDFAELHAGLGGALLLPIVDAWPVVLEAFPVLVADARGLRSGAAARLFWGAHGFPRLGTYVVSFGLVLEARWLAPKRSTCTSASTSTPSRCSGPGCSSGRRSSADPVGASRRLLP
jgi:hypothetical protein